MMKHFICNRSCRQRSCAELWGEILNQVGPDQRNMYTFKHQPPVSFCRNARHIIPEAYTLWRESRAVVRPDENSKCWDIVCLSKFPSHQPIFQKNPYCFEELWAWYSKKNWELFKKHIYVCAVRNPSSLCCHSSALINASSLADFQTARY